MACKKSLNIRTLKNKIIEHGRHKLYKYEQEYYRKNRRDKADYLAQRYARLKAFVWKKKVKCITCDKMMSFQDCQWCHWIEKKSNGTYRCRWEERNIYACCEQCNKRNQQTHTRRLTAYVTKIYGARQVAKRQQEDWKTHPKPKRYEIDEFIEYYKNKIKELESL